MLLFAKSQLRMRCTTISYVWEVVLVLFDVKRIFYRPLGGHMMKLNVLTMLENRLAERNDVCNQ